MIDITTLKIDGGILMVKAAVKSLSYFTNVTIDKVIFYNQSGYSADEEKAVKLYTLSVGEQTVDTVLTEAQLGISFSSNLIIAKFIAGGIPAADTPCGMDVAYVLGATFDYCPINNLIVESSAELGTGCNIPKHFIDMLLGFKALKMACETGKITKAISLYTKMFDKTHISGYNVPRCKCHV